jgi:hypothetical protein
MTFPLRFTCLLAGLATLCLSSLAAAQVERSDFDQGGGYHEFRDDLLNSDVMPSHGSIIRPPPPAARCMLIRPRVSFVREMYKSVESI